MEKKKLSFETCTREQFVEVVRAAKERKKNWERKMKKEMESREEMRRQAWESHYYDIDLA